MLCHQLCLLLPASISSNSLWLRLQPLSLRSSLQRKVWLSLQSPHWWWTPRRHHLRSRWICRLCIDRAPIFLNLNNRYLNSLTWFCSYSDSGCNFVSKGPCHGQTWDILVLKPYSKWTNRVLIWISERIDSSTTVDNSRSFVVLAWFLVSTNGLCDQLVTSWELNHNSSWISNIHTEKLLAQCHHWDTSRSRKADVHVSIE